MPSMEGLLSRKGKRSRVKKFGTSRVSRVGGRGMKEESTVLKVGTSGVPTAF